MFINNLLIKGNQGCIRNIKFQSGVNIITTPINESRENGVGKSTVIDFLDILFGAQYSDKKKNFSDEVCEIIISNNLSIELNITITDTDYNLAFDFEKAKNKYSINGIRFGEKKYRIKLKTILFPDAPEELSFRDLISRFISFSLSENAEDVLKYRENYSTNSDYEALYTYFLNSDTNKNISKIIEFRKKQSDFKNAKKDKKLALAEVPKIFEKSFQKIEGYNEKNAIFIKYQQAVDEYQEIKLQLKLLEDNQRSQEKPIDEEVVNILISELGFKVPEIMEAFNKVVKFNEVRENNRINRFKKIEAELLSNLNKFDNKIKNLESDLNSFINFSNGEETFDLNKYNKIITNRFIETSSKEILTLEDAPPIESTNELISLESLSKFNLNLKNFSKQVFDISYELEKDIKWSKDNSKLPVVFKENHGSATGDLRGLLFALVASIIENKRHKIFPTFILQDINEVSDQTALLNVFKIVKAKNIQLIMPILGSKLSNNARKNNYIALELAPDDKLLEPKTIQK